jgi:heptosyltransferase-2/heptosyltransferase-3
LIIAGPFLRALRQAAPNARLRFLVDSSCRDAAKLISGIDEIALVHPYWRPDDNLKLAAQLLARPCDVLVDLNPSPSRTSASLAALVRAPIKASFRKGRADFLFSHLIAAPGEREHMLDRYARLAELLGLNYDPKLEINISSEDQAQAEIMLPPQTPGRLRVGVHPGNFKKFDNRWPEENFVRLADSLKERPDVDLFFFAGPGEAEPVRAIISQLRFPAAMLGPHPVGVTAALLKRLDAFVCNITGTTHLAAAVGTPTFGLYAGYTHAVWRPRDSKHGGAVSDSWESCRDITVETASLRLADFLGRIQARS